MWRQNIVLEPTDAELLEEADCTQAARGEGRGSRVAGSLLEGGRVHRPFFLGAD